MSSQFQGEFNVRALSDTDRMPFGKYKGAKLEDVPASYLIWLWGNGKSEETLCDPLAAYIAVNRKRLKEECAAEREDEDSAYESWGDKYL